jgi:hypothetical protein
MRPRLCGDRRPFATRAHGRPYNGAVRDGALRRSVKAVARALWQVDLFAHRGLRRLRGDKPFLLAGECGRCAACCEAPAIAVGRLTWFLPSLRALFLGWQRVVNGFLLVRAEREGRVFVFRCTHFDDATRLCDSYESRPGMCRDYPRLVLWQPDPHFLPGCAYRAVSPRARELRLALESRPLTPEQRVRLRDGLHLDDDRPVR